MMVESDASYFHGSPALSTAGKTSRDIPGPANRRLAWVANRYSFPTVFPSILARQPHLSDIFDTFYPLSLREWVVGFRPCAVQATKVPKNRGRIRHLMPI